jgi:hypothetical protein
MVWGGIWMLPLLLPLMNNRAIVLGMLFSLLPSAMMLFIVLPSMGKGTMGLGFGIITPLVVISLNFVYGIVAATWYRSATS